jgi:hypothetical protein
VTLSMISHAYGHDISIMISIALSEFAGDTMGYHEKN